MSLLIGTLGLSFGGAVVALMVGRHSAALARGVALLAMAGCLALTLVAAAGFTPGAQAISLVDTPWISFIGARFHLAVDGISLALVALTGVAGLAGVLFSWNIDDRVGGYFALYLTLIGGVYGVFLSADAFLLFVFYEIAIVPKYFLIAGWGSTRRSYAAMKLAIYSFASSALVLAALLWIHAAGGAAGFSFPELAAAGTRLTSRESLVVFGLLFFGFATLAGLVPLHTWAPTGHVAAPTAASMLLAGVVMKLGAYGCLRVAMPLLPSAFVAWQPVIGWLAAGGILYAALIALAQRDFKFVIGYSSVSHMGFVMLGLAAANERAVGAAVLQMISHGVIAGLLFAVVGRMVYDRLHTRDLMELRDQALARRLPFVAGAFILATLASMGLPGFSGFPAELGVLMGTWAVRPLWVIVAAMGVIVVAAFSLRAASLAFFGETRLAASTGQEKETLPPVTLPEKAGAVLLLGATLLVGIKPDVLLDWIMPSLGAPLFQALFAKGSP